MIYPNWTKEEIELLKKNYPFIENELLSKNLNHSISSIITKANRYLNLKKFKTCRYCGVSVNGLANNSIVCDNCRIEHVKNRKKEYYAKNKKGLMGKRLWTKEELEYLKKNYPFKTNEELKQYLGHSINSIITKANYYLKLRKIKFCKLCGMDIMNLSHNAIFCKSCCMNARKNYKKFWRIKNIKTMLKKSYEWRLKNTERKKEMDRLWRLNNKEKKRADDRAYYAKMKRLRPHPKCIDCGELLLGKSFKTKRCLDCNKLHKILKLKEHRNKNIQHCRELNRKYTKNRRDKENQRRIKLGLPLIGNNFRKEQELLFYIKNLFPNKRIVYHDRAILGNGWELDIFIPELNLAFEYYGRQHFNFNGTRYWKNYEEFEAQKLRDRLKRVLCKINQITLIEVYHYEKLDEQLVLKKLFEKNISPNQLKLLVYDHSRYEIKNESKEEM